MPQAYINQFGRRPGRGIRPWLLIPKVIAVALYIGGLGAVLVFWLTSNFSTLGKQDPQRLFILNQINHLMVYLVVPSFLLAMVSGILLLLQHPRQFIRMRWLQVKLLALAILIPSAHSFCSSRMALLRSAYNGHTVNDTAARQFTWGLCLTLLGSITIVILGRLKPRLGQNWANAYRPSSSAET